MKRRYIWSREQGNWVEKLPFSGVNASPAPVVWNDLPGYLSPCGTGYVEGRAARREDLKRNNCIDARDIGNVSDGRLVETPGHPDYDPDYAKDYERDRSERVGERVLTDWPDECKRAFRGRR